MYENNKQLRDIRAKMGLTRKVFGNLVGRSVSAIWDYEQNKRDCPLYVVSLAAEAFVTMQALADKAKNFEGWK